MDSLLSHCTYSFIFHVRDVLLSDAVVKSTPPSTVVVLFLFDLSPPPITFFPPSHTYSLAFGIGSGAPVVYT
jgi:hypothetical protein